MTRASRFFVIAGLLVVAALAMFVGPWADPDPDGLERAATESGFAGDARDHDLADSPVADYSLKGVENERLATGLSGLVGVLVVFGVGVGVFAVIGAKRSRGRGNRP